MRHAFIAEIGLYVAEPLAAAWAADAVVQERWRTMPPPGYAELPAWATAAGVVRPAAAVVGVHVWVGPEPYSAEFPPAVGTVVTLSAADFVQQERIAFDGWCQFDVPPGRYTVSVRGRHTDVTASSGNTVCVEMGVLA